MINNNVIKKLQEYTDLTKIGDSYKCKCPFHEESSEIESLVIVGKNIEQFHCFGCGKNGTLEELLFYYTKEQL